ncbi:MAG: hypothetical protein WB711_05990 [Terriglobales bacterium]
MTAKGLAKRFYVLPNPVENLWEAKLAAIHRAVDEIMPGLRIDFDIATVAPQEDVSRRERDAVSL